MKIQFKVFGFTLASIELELPETEDTPRLTPIDKGVKGMSNWWVRRMNR